MDDFSGRVLAAVEKKPGQTAREIAAHLGVKKKAVNAALYASLKRLVEQDNAHRWYPCHGADEQLLIEFPDPSIPATLGTEPAHATNIDNELTQSSICFERREWETPQEEALDEGDDGELEVAESIVEENEWRQVEGDWDQSGLISAVRGVLDDFSGEESIKQLFWSVLSYPAVQHPLPVTWFLSFIRPQILSMEMLSQIDDTLLISLHVRSFSYRLVRYVSRELRDRHLSCVLVIRCCSSETWRIVIPETRRRWNSEVTRTLVRMLDLPGSRRARNSTAKSVASLCAVDVVTGDDFSWTEIRRRVAVYFPGAFFPPSQAVLRRMPRIAPYIQAICRYPILTSNQERGTDLRGHEKPPDGSEMPYARWRLAVQNLRFAAYRAMQFWSDPRIAPDDLLQEANCGLIEAASRFDSSMGHRFISYGVHWIDQRMMAWFHADWNIIRWPEHRVGDLIKRNRKGDIDGLHAGEIAVSYLHGQDRAVPDPVDWEEAFCEADYMRWLLAGLGDRDRFILTEYFELPGSSGRSLKECGEYLGISRERARQIKERALKSLRDRTELERQRATPSGIGPEAGERRKRKCRTTS